MKVKKYFLAGIAAAVLCGAPDLLAQVFFHTYPKGANIETGIGNEDESYPDLTLVQAKSPADAVRGSWGGNMSKASMGSNVYLDELFIDIPAQGPLTANVKMNMTLKRGSTDIPIVVVATYNNGQALADGMRWAKVPWHRTVPSTGQKDDIEGNQLVLRADPSGGLKGVFEGDDGFTFTVASRKR